MNVPHVCLVSLAIRKGQWDHGTEVIDGSELLCGCLESNPSSYIDNALNHRAISSAF